MNFVRVYFIAEKSLAEQLYARTAGIKSAFYGLITRRRRLLVVGMVLALLVPAGGVLAVALTRGTFTAWWLNFGLLIYMLVVTSPFWTMATIGEATSTPESEDAIKAVGKLLEASGYEVVDSPRTGKRKIDPLLVGLDLFAQGEKRALAIEVQTLSESTDPVDSYLHSPSDLLTAAWALESFLQEPEEIFRRVDAMIVFVGKKPDERARNIMRDIWKEEEVQIIEIPDLEVVDQILKTDSKEELRNMAIRYLGISTNDEPPSVPQDDFNVLGGVA